MKRFRPTTPVIIAALLTILLVIMSASICQAQQFGIAPVYLTERVGGDRGAENFTNLNIPQNRVAFEARAIYAQQGLFAGYQARLTVPVREGAGTVTNSTSTTTTATTPNTLALAPGISLPSLPPLEWQRIEVGCDPVFLMSTYPLRVSIPSKYLIFGSFDTISSPYGNSAKFNGAGIRFISRQGGNILDVSAGLHERSGYTVEAKLGWLRDPVFATVGIRQQKFGFVDDVTVVDKEGKVTVETRSTSRVITAAMLELGMIF